MDIGEIVKLFNPAKARDGNLALREHVLKPENCFNPLVIKRVNPSTPDEVISIQEISDLNKTYFDFLSGTREAIKSEETDSIIEEMSALHERLFRLGQPDDFEGFLNFKGLFLNCRWHVCSSDSDFPQDIISIKENLPSSMKFSSLLKEDETLKDRLSDIFKDVVKINTKKIPTLRYKKNPFWQILTGHLEPEYDAFDHALECLGNKEFQRQWQVVKSRLNDKAFKEQQKKGKGDRKSKVGVNKRVIDNFKIAEYADFKSIPKGAQAITSPVKNGAWGFANVLRGLRPDDRTRDYCKSIRTVANKHLSKTGKHLIHCDRTREVYWTSENNRTLFQPGTRGRTKRG
jgi:hypothetical protein